MIYIFIISLLVLQTLVVTESLNLNVRTTLFTPADLARKSWNRRDVALLRARMYFQGLLPPMEISQSPEYVRSLIRYIENCYAAVNREAFDSETGSILTIAVSDVIGGYLKMVALPVAKSAYYSGELPTQDAIKLFRYYDDIKEQLSTNGQGWSEQLSNIVKTNTVRGTRSDPSLMKIKNPCQKLYLQNNKQNLTMPIPSIDWKKRMMFVPLTNQPIIDLRSPYISSVLQQFYQIATACERTLNPERQYFQGTFEDWVNEAVVPHLSDDDLYTAFKGILCLIENSNLVSGPESWKPSTHFIQNLFLHTSKKTMIIVIILALELICCIPTLLYCIQKRKRSKKNVCSADTLSSASSGCASPKCNSGSKKVCYADNTAVFYELSSRSSSLHSPTKLSSKVNFNHYNKFMINEANSDLSTASVSRRSYSSITDAATTADEASTKKYSTDKKVLSRKQQLIHYKQTETDKIDVTQHQTQISKWPLPRTNSTSTAINLNIRTLSKNDTSNDTGETVTLSTVLPQDKGCSKVLRKSKRFRPRHIIESLNQTYNPFPSSGNVRLHEQSQVPNTVEGLKLELFDDRLSDIALIKLDSGKIVDVAPPHVSTETRTKNSQVSCNRSVKSYRSISTKNSVRTFKVLDDHKIQMVDNQDSPKEMRIDRPRQRICAKVSKHGIPMDSEVPTNRKGILKAGEEKMRVRPKISKIPKKTRSPGPPCDAPRPARREPVGAWRKSKIPKLDRALDDSAIHSTPRDRDRDKKHNVTL